MKLWKVNVNNWGLSAPLTLYATSKHIAQEISSHFPASDRVQYAGNYRAERGAKLILYTNAVLKTYFNQDPIIAALSLLEGE